MTVHLAPTLRRTVVLPTSKSISARALIVNALAETPCALQGLSDCDDTNAVLRAMAGHPTLVDIGAAGTAMRFLTAFYATREGEEHVLTGTERMKHRPIGILVEALRQLGADVVYEGETGFPPLRIHGRRLEGGAVHIAADVSSQYISALLMLGPVLEKGLELHLTGNIASRPYIVMTLRLMEQFGASTAFEGNTIVVRPGGYRRTESYSVEPDWSAASYWYELVALSPDAEARVVLPGLCAESLQGDSICARYFEHFGVRTEFTPDGAVLTKDNSVQVVDNSTQRIDAAACPKRVTLDFSDCPDLAQTFVVTAALQNRPFRFTGLRSLKIKETDRIAALIAEMAKLGRVLYESAEGELAYDGSASAGDAPRAASPISISTYEDHRMAMAFAPAAYLYDGLHIEHPEVVSKSYPNFWQDLPIF